MKRLLTGNYTRWKHKNAGEVALLRGLLINVCCCHWEHLEGFRFHWHNLMIYVTTSLVNLTLQMCYFSHIKHAILVLSVCWGILKTFFWFWHKEVSRTRQGGPTGNQNIWFKKKAVQKSGMQNSEHICKLMSSHITWKVMLHKSLKCLFVLNHHFFKWWKKYSDPPLN